MNVASFVLFCAAFVVMLLTAVLIFKFKTFYYAILISANIDTLGMLLFMLAVIIASPNAEFALKAALVLIFALITNPISSHATARSAFLGGYRQNKDKKG